MQKAILSFVVVLALGRDLGLASDAVDGTGAAARFDVQMLSEQKRFAECLACVYDPALWISYDNRLYFMPRNDSQRQQIAAMSAAREAYVAFTSRQTQHQFVAKLLAESGLGADWQKKLLVPYAATNRYLTPVLDRLAQVVERYSVLGSLPPENDTIIRAGETVCCVMGFGRGASDAYRTNAVLVKEGMRTYSTQSNERKTVEAFTDAGLTAAETAALNQAVAAFQRAAARLGQSIAAAQTNPAEVSPAVAESKSPAPVLAQPTAGAKAKQDFEDLKARATETSPFMEFLLAKAFLEGKGTAKDEQLGLLWMNKAAHDGSGEATTYLEGLPRK